MVNDRGYVLMTYARSGASYLAQLLGSTGCLGRPEDWFNSVGLRKLGFTDYPQDREGQIAKILSEGRSDNGVFGVKMSPVRNDELRGFDWAERLGPLAYIHLIREDRLGQAISNARAEQTGQYRSTTRAHGIARYDRRRILNSLTNQLYDEARVRQYFAVNGIMPLEITYEMLIADQPGTLQRIAKFLSVGPAPSPRLADISLEVQRDSTSEEWRARFLQETGNPNRISDLQIPSLRRYAHSLLFGRQ